MTTVNIALALALACLAGLACLIFLYAALVVSGNHSQAEDL